MSRLEGERDKAIGIFDSGIGGLTVVSAIWKRLPREQLIYFGDTARVPYGSKSKETVEKFASQIVSFLIEQRVKILVAACNTMSALALEAVREEYNLPLLGVIEPGARKAVETSKKKKIGVIGTLGTISSGAYRRAIHSLDPSCLVFEQACPLFVPLVEEGWTNQKVTHLVVKEYLTPLKESGIDTLVLGCTHYPLLKKIITEVIGQRITLIDSAEETALEVESRLKDMGLLRTSKAKPFHKFFVSDLPLKFAEMGERFLGNPLPQVVRVSIEERE